MYQVKNLSCVSKTAICINILCTGYTPATLQKCGVLTLTSHQKYTFDLIVVGVGSTKPQDFILL